MDNFSVLYREVREQFSHDVVEVGHAVYFSRKVGDASEEFDKFFHAGHCVGRDLLHLLELLDFVR